MACLRLARFIAGLVAMLFGMLLFILGCLMTMLIFAYAWEVPWLFLGPILALLGARLYVANNGENF